MTEKQEIKKKNLLLLRNSGLIVSEFVVESGEQVIIKGIRINVPSQILGKRMLKKRNKLTECINL